LKGKLTADEIFRIHPKIRWASLATPEGEVIFSKMREGAQSLSPKGGEEAFMQLGPQAIFALKEHLSPWAGPLLNSFGEYEKVMMIMTKVGENYLALAIDRGKTPNVVLPQVIPKIVAALDEIRQHGSDQSG
jgi:hypothetical protein